MRSEHKMSYDEVSAFTGWRRVVAWVQRPGARKAVKKSSHRKDRHRARQALKKGEEL